MENYLKRHYMTDNLEELKATAKPKEGYEKEGNTTN